VLRTGNSTRRLDSLTVKQRVCLVIRAYNTWCFARVILSYNARVVASEKKKHRGRHGHGHMIGLGFGLPGAWAADRRVHRDRVHSESKSKSHWPYRYCK
jgi:hypothetical protein